MSDDIVERLRVWSDNAKEQDATEIVVGLCQAADEIERLRNDLDGSQLAYRGASYDRNRMRAERDDARQLIHAAADEIERLRKERDEAEPLLNELWDRRTDATEIRAEIERLRKERETYRTRYQQLLVDTEQLNLTVARLTEDLRRMDAITNILYVSIEKRKLREGETS